MTNCYCINLDLPVSIDYTLVDNFIPQIDNSRIKLFEISPNQDLESYLRRYAISVVKNELFYTPPNTIGPIHVDGVILTDKCKLNFTLKGKGSKMLWWKANHDDNFNINDGSYYDTTSAIFFTHNECEELWSDDVGQPGLVQVGIPHSVNTSNEHRWCFSYSLYDMINNQPLTWAVAVKRLKKFMRA